MQHQVEAGQRTGLRLSQRLLVHGCFGMERVSFMRFPRVVLSRWLFGLGLLSGSVTAAEAPLLRQEFAGARSLMASPELARFQKVAALPESLALWERWLTGWARQLPGGMGAGGGGAEWATWIRGWWEMPSVLEVHTDGGGELDWALGVRLGEGSAGEQGRGLAGMLAKAWGGGIPEEDAVGGEVALPAGGGVLRWGVRGDWLMVGLGKRSWAAVQARLEEGRAFPGDAGVAEVWRGEADLAEWARRRGWAEAPPVLLTSWPRVEWKVEPRQGRLRTQARLVLSGAWEGVLSKWVVPTPLVRDPLVGFTAMQGADLWLGNVSVLQGFGVQKWPSQVFQWSLLERPWQQYFAALTPSPTQLMSRLVPALPLRVMTNSTLQGQTFSLRTTNEARRVELHGIPFFAPFLEAMEVEGESLVHGGLFLPLRGAPPAPDGLLSQVTGRTNLVWYDWEVTGEEMVRAAPTGAGRMETNRVGRLQQWMHLVQFGQMLTQPRGNLPRTPAGAVAVPGTAWVMAALPFLGETITEVTLTGPKEMSVVRQSTTGLNSMELVALLHWLEGGDADQGKEVVGRRSAPAPTGRVP